MVRGRKAGAVRMGAVISRGPVLVVRPMFGILTGILVPMITLTRVLVIEGRSHCFVLHLAVPQLSHHDLGRGDAIAHQEDERDE